MDSYMWNLAGVVTHVISFVYANQSEFENIKENLDDTKTHTKNVIYPKMMEIQLE